MIPADRFLLDGDTAWMIVGPIGPGADVIPGDYAIEEWKAMYHRPCDGCDGSPAADWTVGLPECVNCIEGRHAFDVEVALSHIEMGCTRGEVEEGGGIWPRTTYRVSIVPGMVLPIVTSGHLAPGYPYITPKIGGGWVEHYIPRAMAERRSIILPSAAAPGMWAVKLRVAS